MNKNIALFAVALLTACAAQDRAATQDIEQAVRDYIEVRELAEADEMRTSNRDSWQKIDQHFIIYEASREFYLLEFVRRCHELDQYPVVPDVRKSGNRVRARFDTVRGCHIAKLFPLTEGDVAELEAIGESPGSRN